MSVGKGDICTVQTARDEPEPVVPVEQLDLVADRAREELGRQVGGARAVELDEVGGRLGGGGEGRWWCLWVGGVGVWVEDVDEEVAVF